MYSCVNCGLYACMEEHPEVIPKNCPMHQRETLDRAKAEYADPENQKIFATAADIESSGYCQWPRVKETIQFCLRMGYEKIGMAFCKGLSDEARIVSGLFKEVGIEVVGVCCKAGGTDKACLGIPEEFKMVEPGEFETACNPIGQAMLMNEKKTQFNIILGLCVGHDSLFIKYSDALVSTLVVKDRVTGHNPVAAIYGSEAFFKKRVR